MLSNSRLPDPLGLPPPRLHPHEGLLHHPHVQHQLPERISDGSRLSDGGISRLSDSLSEAHSPPLMATNLSVTGPLRVAVPSPHTPSSRGSPPPPASQPTPQGQSQGQGLIRVATPPPPNPKPPQIHRPFSPAWYDKDDEPEDTISGENDHRRPVGVSGKPVMASDEHQFFEKRFEVLWKRKKKKKEEKEKIGIRGRLQRFIEKILEETLDEIRSKFGERRICWMMIIK